MITWDERKRRENIRKHRIDLADLEPVFDYPMITVEDTRERYGELRLQSLGMWRGRVVFLMDAARRRNRAPYFLSLCQPHANRNLLFIALAPSKSRLQKLQQNLIG